MLSSRHHDQRYGFGDPDRICRGHRLQPTQLDFGVLLSAWIKPMLTAGAFGFSSEPVGKEQGPVGPRAYRGGRPDRVQARTLAALVPKRKDSPYRRGRSADWFKSKNLACAAVKREAEEDWEK